MDVDREIRAYYTASTPNVDEDDRAWSKGIEKDLQKAWDED
jgi:hypothetical protein